MIPHLYAFPEQARFGHTIPKNKIYEHADATKKIKELFVRQIELITWAYKLAPETINIKATADVTEIQIFHLLLKDRELQMGVLRSIDLAIPFPIIFELHHDAKIKLAAAYKRPNESDREKWVVSDYFTSEWLNEDTPRKTLPLVFDLTILYTELLGYLLPYPAHKNESLQAQVLRIERIKVKEREVQLCESRLRTERQFNFKVEINQELRQLKQQLAMLISE